MAIDSQSNVKKIAKKIVYTPSSVIEILILTLLSGVKKVKKVKYLRVVKKVKYLRAQLDNNLDWHHRLKVFCGKHLVPVSFEAC